MKRFKADRRREKKTCGVAQTVETLALKTVAYMCVLDVIKSYSITASANYQSQLMNRNFCSETNPFV